MEAYIRGMAEKGVVMVVGFLVFGVIKKSVMGQGVSSE